MEVVKLTIKEVCIALQKDGIPMEDIGKLIGVSRLQIHNYVKGRTLNPKPRVCKKVFDNVVIDGKKVLVGPYQNEDHLHMTIEMLDKAQS